MGVVIGVSCGNIGIIKGGILMRDSMKITVKYQFIYVLLMQLAASGATFVFGTVAFWYFLTVNIVKEILSIIFIGVNFAFLYVAAKKFALRDNKPYTPLRPSKAKGVILGAMVSIVTLILMLLFIFVWSKYSDEAGIHGMLPTAINVIFYFWSFPYNGIMGLSMGAFMPYSAVIMLVMPIVATTAGYIGGCRKIELVEKFEEFMYEKKD